MRTVVVCVAILVIAPTLTGCFGSGDGGPEVEESVFSSLCDEGFPPTTWYHYANATTLRSLNLGGYASLVPLHTILIANPLNCGRLSIVN